MLWFLMCLRTVLFQSLLLSFTVNPNYVWAMLNSKMMKWWRREAENKTNNEPTSIMWTIFAFSKRSNFTAAAAPPRHLSSQDILRPSSDGLRWCVERLDQTCEKWYRVERRRSKLACEVLNSSSRRGIELFTHSIIAISTQSEARQRQDIRAAWALGSSWSWCDDVARWELGYDDKIQYGERTIINGEPDFAKVCTTAPLLSSEYLVDLGWLSWQGLTISNLLSWLNDWIVA